MMIAWIRDVFVVAVEPQGRTRSRSSIARSRGQIFQVSDRRHPRLYVSLDHRVPSPSFPCRDASRTMTADDRRPRFSFLLSPDTTRTRWPFPSSDIHLRARTDPLRRGQGRRPLTGELSTLFNSSRRRGEISSSLLSRPAKSTSLSKPSSMSRAGNRFFPSVLLLEERTKMVSFPWGF